MKPVFRYRIGMALRFVIAFGLLATVALTAAMAQVASDVTVTTTPLAPVPNVIQGIVIDSKPLIEQLQPYILAAIAAVIALGVKILYGMAQKWADQHGIKLDDSYRAGLTTSVQNVAAGLVAKGLVTIEQNGKITVPDNVLTEAAKDIVENRAPDAVEHFDMTPQQVADRIVEQIPQLPAASLPAKV